MRFLTLFLLGILTCTATQASTPFLTCYGRSEKADNPSHYSDEMEFRITLSETSDGIEGALYSSFESRRPLFRLDMMGNSGTYRGMAGWLDVAFYHSDNTHSGSNDSGNYLNIAVPDRTRKVKKFGISGYLTTTTFELEGRARVEQAEAICVVR